MINLLTIRKLMLTVRTLLLRLKGIPMQEQIFQSILCAKDDDYAVQAQLLAIMKPNGWR